MQQQRMNPHSRRGRRHKVEFGAFAKKADGTEAVLALSDLSYDGCQLSTTQDFRVGEKVKLNLPRLGQILAEIRWSAEGKAGALFLTDEESSGHEAVGAAATANIHPLPSV